MKLIIPQFFRPLWQAMATMMVMLCEPGQVRKEAAAAELSGIVDKLSSVTILFKVAAI